MTTRARPLAPAAPAAPQAELAPLLNAIARFIARRQLAAERKAVTEG